MPVRLSPEIRIYFCLCNVLIGGGLFESPRQDLDPPLYLFAMQRLSLFWYLRCVFAL